MQEDDDNQNLVLGILFGWLATSFIVGRAILSGLRGGRASSPYGAIALGVVILGLVTAVAVPYYAVTRPSAGTAFGGWIMPVVPPMVSAATGALLVPYLPDGQLRVTMLLGCYAMFGLSLAASALVIGRIWDQLLHHGIGPAAMVPTLWIVLGPVGQSITAVKYAQPSSPHHTLVRSVCHSSLGPEILNGRPCTFVSDTASTRYRARISMAS